MEDFPNLFDSIWNIHSACFSEALESWQNPGREKNVNKMNVEACFEL